MSDQDTVTRAKRRVAAIEGFYIHLAVFVAVNILLLAINATTGGPWWVQWPFLGWGIGVLAHAAAVFGRMPEAISRWEERKTAEIKRELDAGAAPKAIPDPSSKS
jgi:hypothetical protein